MQKIRPATKRLKRYKACELWQALNHRRSTAFDLYRYASNYSLLKCAIGGVIAERLFRRSCVRVSRNRGNGARPVNASENRLTQPSLPGGPIAKRRRSPDMFRGIVSAAPLVGKKSGSESLNFSTRLDEGDWASVTARLGPPTRSPMLRLCGAKRFRSDDLCFLSLGLQRRSPLRRSTLGS
jgi:hypothetical protein